MERANKNYYDVNYLQNKNFMRVMKLWRDPLQINGEVLVRLWLELRQYVFPHFWAKQGLKLLIKCFFFVWKKGYFNSSLIAKQHDGKRFIAGWLEECFYLKVTKLYSAFWVAEQGQINACVSFSLRYFIGGKIFLQPALKHIKNNLLAGEWRTLAQSQQWTY